MANNNIDQETEEYFNEPDEDNDFTNPEDSVEFYLSFVTFGEFNEFASFQPTRN
jgi:hypothetical protein